MAWRGRLASRPPQGPATPLPKRARQNSRTTAVKHTWRRSARSKRPPRTKCGRRLTLPTPRRTPPSRPPALAHLAWIWTVRMPMTARSSKTPGNSSPCRRSCDVCAAWPWPKSSRPRRSFMHPVDRSTGAPAWHGPRGPTRTGIAVARGNLPRRNTGHTRANPAAGRPFRRVPGGCERTGQSRRRRRRRRGRIAGGGPGPAGDGRPWTGRHIAWLAADIPDPQRPRRARGRGWPLIQRNCRRRTGPRAGTPARARTASCLSPRAPDLGGPPRGPGREPRVLGRGARRHRGARVRPGGHAGRRGRRAVAAGDRYLAAERVRANHAADRRSTTSPATP